MRTNDMKDVRRIAVFHGFIVSANPDGSIPVNAYILAKVDPALPQHAEALCAWVNEMAIREEERKAAVTIELTD